MLTSTSSGCFHKDDCRPWTIEIHAGSSEADVQVECLVDVIDDLVSSDEPQEKLKRFTTALHEVFAFGRSKKHMIQRQLGRLEPTPSLKYRTREVMRNMPVMSTCTNLRIELYAQDDCTYEQSVPHELHNGSRLLF